MRTSIIEILRRELVNHIVRFPQMRKDKYVDIIVESIEPHRDRSAYNFYRISGEVLTGKDRGQRTSFYVTDESVFATVGRLHGRQSPPYDASSSDPSSVDPSPVDAPSSDAPSSDSVSSETLM